MDFELPKSRATKHFIENLNKEYKNNGFLINLLSADSNIHFSDHNQRAQLKNERCSSAGHIDLIEKNQLKTTENNLISCKGKKRRFFEDQNICFSLRHVSMDEKITEIKNEKNHRNFLNKIQEKLIFLIKKENQHFPRKEKFKPILKDDDDG